MAAFNTGLNGIQLLERAAYDDASFVPDANTLYIVRSAAACTLYLGSVQITGGTMPSPITQAQYDAIETKTDPLYFIYEE